MTPKHRILILLLIVGLSPGIALAKRAHPEKWYQEKWCKEHAGQVEIVLPDGTRCDCLTGTHAVEFDFGSKWAEAVGQSVYYSLQTGKKAGIVLIMENEGDYKYWIRLNSTIEHFKLPIKAWKMERHTY